MAPVRLRKSALTSETDPQASATCSVAEISCELSCRLTRRPESGFGLLEALVALVLLSSIGFAILAWAQQNLDTMQRMKGFYAEQTVRRQVIDLAKTLNPMKEPAGESVIDGKRFVWGVGGRR